jgi:hypothetical protein
MKLNVKRENFFIPPKSGCVYKSVIIQRNIPNFNAKNWWAIYQKLR